MVWVLAVIVVGLIAVIAELFLSYQKRATDLRLRQDPIRSRIREHHRAMRESVERIKGAAESQLEEFERDSPQKNHQIEAFARELRQVEAELFGDDYDPAAARVDEDFLTEEERKVEGEGEKEKEDPNLERTTRARELIEEIEGHANSLHRDVDVVKRTLGLLEGKLRRSATAGKEKATAS